MLQPVHFSRNVVTPTPVRVNKTNLVLWRGAKNQLHCFPDVCPHRGAQLSKGRVTESSTLQCSYHGWQFNEKGKCAKVPQAQSGQYIPKACNVKPWKVVEKAGIIWVAPGTESYPDITSRIGDFDTDHHFVTDYVMDARYSYELQIENLLDPAHIHFVHNGFQGDESKAGHILAKNIHVDSVNMTLTGVFQHTNNANVPVIRIVFHWPSIVDVSIYNKNEDVVRKNIIYVAPQTEGTCRVLFRDVAMKKFLAPPLARMFLSSPSIENTYQAVNQEVVHAIMKQDVEILESQQLNAPSKYLLITESDRLILEYIKVSKLWAESAKICASNP